MSTSLLVDCKGRSQVCDEKSEVDFCDNQLVTLKEIELDENIVLDMGVSRQLPTVVADGTRWLTQANFS